MTYKSSNHDGTECDVKGVQATINELLLMSSSNVILQVALKFIQIIRGFVEHTFSNYPN